MNERPAKRIRSRSPLRANRPHSRSRSRSRSPRRQNHREGRDSKPRIGKGFRWKNKSDRGRPSDGDERSRRDRPMDRGYRSRHDEPDRHDSTSNTRDREKHKEPDNGIEGDKGNSSHRSRQTDRDSRRREGEEDSDKRDRRKPKTSETTETDAKMADKFGISGAKSSSSSTSKKESHKSSAPPHSNDLFMTVKVNDRLGTTTMVPCLPSDNIGDFKKLVAMRIGRRPHEIMLKRQGERPFRDMLTLEDYGVGNGAQLDLELDTGD